MLSYDYISLGHKRIDTSNYLLIVWIQVKHNIKQNLYLNPTDITPRPHQLSALILYLQSVLPLTKE